MQSSGPLGSRRCSWVLALWVLSQACTSDKPEPGTDPPIDEDTDLDPTTPPDDPTVCPANTMGGTLGPFEGTTTGRPDDYASTCGGAGSPDTTIAFVAPTDGDWVVARESGFGGILAVYDACGGVELACDEDAVELALRAGESVILVVDGERGVSGDFTLVAFAGTSSEPERACDDGFDNDLDGDEDCTDRDCRSDPSCTFACVDATAGASVPVTVDGDTTFAVDDLTASCDPGGVNDLAFDFTAPADGAYVFHATGLGYDTVLYVLDGCRGAELGCNEEASLHDSRVAVDLSAGQQVVAVVAAMSGPVTLTVSEQPATELVCDDSFDDDGDGDQNCRDSDCDLVCIEDCTDGIDNDGDGDLDCLDVYCQADTACTVGCPMEVASGVGPISDDTTGRPNATAGSCGGADGSDWSVAFTAPTDGVYGFATSSTLVWWGSLLYVLDGDCTGPELACDDAPNDNGDIVSVALSAGQTVVVVVDSVDVSHPGEFELLIALDVVVEDVCDDLLDQDFDGFFDCWDTDCTDDPTCQEDCGNQRDDDENGLLDCLDPVCAADPICNPSCPETVLSGDGILTVRGNVEGRPDRLPGGSCGGAGPEQTFGFTAPADGDYAFAVSSDERTNFSSVVYVLDGCGGPELACADRPFVDGGDIAVATLAAGQTVIVVVEAIGTERIGEFFLTVYETAPTETVCGDGVDQDLDYRVDCRDLDCATDSACPEDCGNGVDDDADLAVDCMDTPCAGGPSCAVACPEEVLVPGIFSGSTRGAPDGLAGTCEGAGASDVSFAFTAPTTADWTFAMNPEGTGFNTALYVLDSCGGAELACVDFYYPYPYDADRITLPLVAGQSVVVVADGAQGDSGKFELQVFELGATEVRCDDGIDDDLDGFGDCADVDCAASCFEDCTNGVDDDDDRAIDCQDEACVADPDCVPSCSDHVVSNVPTVVVGSTVGGPDYDPSCGGPSASRGVAFTAPADGEYGFGVSELGTGFSAVVTLLAGCGGPELGCERLAYGGERVQTATLSAGDTVIVIVEGLTDEDAVWMNEPNAGTFALEVFEVHPSEQGCDDTFDDDVDGAVDCQDDDCAGFPGCAASCPDDVIGLGTYRGSTLFAHDTRDPGCALAFFDSGSDRSLSFTAPADGEYAFELDTAETAFDWYLSVQDRCGGPELECSSFYGTRLWMTAGQTVIVVVDGGSIAEHGTFVLRAFEVTATEETCDDVADNDRDQLMDCLDPDCAGHVACDCPERTIGSDLPVDLTIPEPWRYDASSVGSCGGGAYDLTYAFTAPATGTYTMDTFGSTVDTVLYVTDGCGGVELACSDDIVGQDLASRVEVVLTAGQTVIIVLDTADEDVGYGRAELHIR